MAMTEEALTRIVDLGRIQRELSTLVGRQVDLVERSAIEKSRNYIRRRAILNSAEIIHAA